MTTFRNALLEYKASAAGQPLVLTGRVQIDGAWYTLTNTPSGVLSQLPPADNGALVQYIAVNYLDADGALPASGTPDAGTSDMIVDTSTSTSLTATSGP